jgi:HEPN domain-containing protein
MEKREIEARRWLAQAEEDLKTAYDLQKDRRFNWVCFICQQAAEKAVKAIYYLQDEGVEWTHSLYVLIEGDRERHKGCSRAEIFDRQSKGA